MPAEQASILWRALRKTYRTLNQVTPLQPALQKIRSKTLDRWCKPERESDSETLTTVQRSFTIAFTLRSGSNVICSMLAGNGLGKPGEFFQMPFIGGNALVLDGFTRIVSRYQRHGVFGSKMAYAHRAALDVQLRKAIPGYTRIDDILPNHKWVWLTRRDKILQAISLCRAEASKQWACRSSIEEGEQEYTYDFVHILSRVMLIHASEFAWDIYFRENGIHPFNIVYEDFFGDLDRQLPRLTAYLGGQLRKQVPINKHTIFKVQRNEKSYEIQQRFLSDLLRWGSHDLTVELGPAFVRWTKFLNDLGWRI
jgi:LPS sulfotransferase NodH